MSAARTAVAAKPPGPPAPPPLPNEEPAQRDTIWDFADLCLEQTAAALHEAGAASTAEISRGVSIAREAHAEETPAELIELIARIQGHDEERLSGAILQLSEKVALTLTPYPPMIPFGGKLIAPSAFYESFERIHRIAKVLLAPVLFAEDTDAIGVGSVNPVAGHILAAEIRDSVVKRFGIGPFLSVARLDYESWTFLTRKHFEL